MNLRPVVLYCERGARAILSVLLVAGFALAHASVGLDVIPANGDAGPIALFYPSSTPSAVVQRGPFTLDVAEKGAPVAGNGRLIAISHGSGGAPWPQSDLARMLVEAGFVVAMPEHRGDNFHDMSDVGPKSWKRRPAEVSHAIDMVLADPRFAQLAKDKVGVYGMSAGGLTALTFAAGRWSPAQWAKHCQAHIAEDFPTCVGLIARLKGNWADGLKTAIAKTLIRWRFGGDVAWVGHSDPRVRAVVAAVPMAAVFDMQSLSSPPIPVGLVESEKDAWLAPRFHIEAVERACPSCKLIADMKQAGHGALLSPFPPDLDDTEKRLLDDPPGFDRASLPAVHRAITDFFLQNLLP